MQRRAFVSATLGGTVPASCLCHSMAALGGPRNKGAVGLDKIQTSKTRDCKGQFPTGP